MALPFLPHEIIVGMFKKLRGGIADPNLEALLAYINDQWIKNTVFQISAWSVFNREFRANNDVEGLLFHIQDIERVHAIYMDIDNATNVPDMRFSGRRNEIKLISRYGKRSLYQKYLLSNSNWRICTSKFAKMRPSTVGIFTKNKYCSCLREYCENVDLKIAAWNYVLRRKSHPTYVLKNVDVSNYILQLSKI